VAFAAATGVDHAVVADGSIVQAMQAHRDPGVGILAENESPRRQDAKDLNRSDGWA
jgi:hypothetical protein